uniref:Suppressor of RNA-mediated gene silencing n=1 Tax=Tobacco leaf enation phytoreovirus TaxID=288891 RepID=A2RQI6_9REOV|nr:unknown [Tobacco leaf enation phytoreovirus]
MDVNTEGFVSLNVKTVVEEKGHEIVMKYDALKRLNLRDFESNISTAAMNTVNSFSYKREAWIASDVKERDIGANTMKAAIFVPGSVLANGMMPKDLVPYGHLVTVLIPVPDIFMLVDNESCLVNTLRVPISAFICVRILNTLRIEVIGSEYDSYYYCSTSRYGKNLIKMSPSIPASLRDVRVSLNELAVVAFRECHDYVVRIVKLLTQPPQGFIPKSHVLRINMCYWYGNVRDSWLKQPCQQRPANTFTYDDRTNVLHRRTMFSASDSFSYSILWRGWDRYKEFLSQDQVSKFLRYIAPGGPMNTYIMTYPSTFEEGVVYLQYRWWTPYVEQSSCQTPTAPKC